MSAKRIEGLSHTVELTHAWINDLDRRLGWVNKPRSYRLLRSVLHALRDCLQPNEIAGLGAQLPTLLRGVYYEQWHPSATRAGAPSRDTFLAQIDSEFEQDPLPDRIPNVMAVFELLSEKITPGEVEDVRRALPGDLRTIWPEPYAASGGARRR